MLCATDSQRQCEEKVSEGGGGMKGSLAAERSSLDRTSLQHSGPDQSPSDGKRQLKKHKAGSRNSFKKLHRRRCPSRAGWLHHRARFWATSKDHPEEAVKASAFLLQRLGPWLEDHMHAPAHTHMHTCSFSHSPSLSLSLSLDLSLSLSCSHDWERSVLSAGQNAGPFGFTESRSLQVLL